MFEPLGERGKVYHGLHRHRGDFRKEGRRYSKRKGSGKRRHLGDHITDTTYTGCIETDDHLCELTKRTILLKEQEAEKAARWNRA